MTPSETHFKRYQQIAALLWKYGGFYPARQMAVPDTFDPQELTVWGSTRWGDRHEASQRT
jgi:hypothetical protein